MLVAGMSDAAQSRIFRTAVAALTVLRLFLAIRLPVFARPASIEDDMLMVSFADSIRNGAWLGPYTERALEKYPGHGMFMAAADWLGMP